MVYGNSKLHIRTYESFHYGTSAERCVGCLRSTCMRFYVNELVSDRF